MVSQFVVNLLLLMFLSLNTNVDVSMLNKDIDITTQGKLRFGLNQPHMQSGFMKMVFDTVNYSNFFRDYNIQYLRFPGGSDVRYFIYNSNDLTNQAKVKLWDYYKARGKERVMDKTNENITSFKFPDNYYESFLKFCVNNKVKPIVELNTCFYAYNNSVYQVGPFLKSASIKKNLQDNQNQTPDGLNDKLKKTLTDQINLTHKYFQKVTWEIGNEENYVYSAATEAAIVDFYVNVIKSLNPQDEVIASFPNTFGEQKQFGGEKKNKAKWAQDYVDKLNSLKLLPKIDYFAPHFYIDVNDEILTPQDLQKRFQDLNFSEFEKTELSYFPSNYKPRFFITEFAIFLGPPGELVNYNSNLHALLFFYFLMNFYSTPSIDGVLYHPFLGKSPFVFVEPEAKAFNNNIAQKNSGYKNISVIPIQAQAVKFFYQNVGEKFVKFFHEGSVSILVTQTGDRYTYFLINTSANDETTDKTKIISMPQKNEELTFTSYNFQDLNSKSNVAVSSTSKKGYKDFSTIEVGKYSVLIIK